MGQTLIIILCFKTIILYTYLILCLVLDHPRLPRMCPDLCCYQYAFSSAFHWYHVGFSVILPSSYAIVFDFLTSTCWVFPRDFSLVRTNEIKFNYIEYLSCFLHYLFRLCNHWYLNIILVIKIILDNIKGKQFWKRIPKQFFLPIRLISYRKRKCFKSEFRTCYVKKIPIHCYCYCNYFLLHISHNPACIYIPSNFLMGFLAVREEMKFFVCIS